MQKKGSSRKSLLIGIIAAIVVLGAVLALVLTQCVGQGESTDPSATVDTAPAVPTYQLYWNLDRELYEGKSEAGMSSRMPESDGYFKVRFALDGQEVTLKVQDRKIINKIDVMSLMGLVFDENGIVVDALDIKEMPVEKIAWQFYVQSAGKTLIKANSSDTYAGMEVQLELSKDAGVYDMTGKEGAVGCVGNPIEGDRIMGIANLAGEVTHVFIYERPNYMLTHEGECQHCKKTVTWYEWVRADKLPVRSGHYQLQNDIALSGQQSMSEQDQKICLDLNGKRVDGKSGNRVYSMHNAGSHLAIMDTSEGQTGVLAAHGKGDQGMVVWVRYGQFHFYSGTLDASDATSRIYAPAVSVQKNTYMYMYGGTIIGGTAAYAKNENTGAYTRGYAGTMYVAGKFVMHDGEIRDGFAQSVTYKKNGTSTTTRGYGGNLFVAGAAEVELNGGVIKNGTAGSAGGNIYVEGTSVITINGTKIQGGRITGKGKNGGSMYIGGKSTVNLKSGSISGGRSYNAAGNVYVSATLNMTGGSISKGQCLNYTTKKVNTESSNFNLFVVNGTFKMYGGRIYGGVGVTDTSSTDKKTATVRLATNAVIKSDVAGERNLTLNSGSIINCRVDKLRDKASIGVYTSRGLFTQPTLQENVDNFFSDIEGTEIIYTENGLFLGRENCVCGKDTHINGCDGTKHLWAPWTSGTALPKTNGNYFLMKDVTTTSQAILSKGHTVRLDLCGKDITYNVSPTYSDGFRVYRSAFESLLVITDTTDNPGTIRSDMPTEAEVQAAVEAKLATGEYDQAKADKIIAGQKAGNFGSVIWCRGGDAILHNGILDGSNLTGSKYGMVVSVAANTASEDGGVTRKGSFTMYGGEIRGATTSSYGAAVYGSSNSNIYIHGGVIRDGVSTGSSGGNVYSLGYFYMDGGVIRDGVAYASGGNLVVDGSKADATITGTAKILNGQAGDPTLKKDIGRGGNIRVVTKGAKLTLGGDALVSGGIAYRSASSNAGYAGNISVNTDTTMTMTGGTVEGGESYRGGNIDVCGSLTITGGTITGGKATHGGNIYVINGAGRELIIEGGTIEKGHATKAGGNINALAPVTISGGVIAEGKALPDSGEPSSSNNGGNIFTAHELTITGDAVIRDGYSGYTGGNITAGVDGSLKADITISGNAQILNGVTDGQLIEGFDGGYGGNIRMSSNTSLTVKDNVLISGGKAVGGKYVNGSGGGGQGGNLYMANAKVEVLGGIIENGTSTGGGGNIGCVSGGTLLLQDVIVRDGDVGTSVGGNIRIRAGGVKLLKITGNTQILGGKAKEGASIYADVDTESAVEISGNALIKGGNVGTEGNGPTIYLYKNTDLVVTENAVIDATEAVGKRGGAIYMYDKSSSLTVDGEAKLLGTKDAAMTHGGVGYLRGDVTIGGNAKLIAGDNGSYGNAIYFYTGNLTLKDNVLVDASGTTCTNGTALYVYSTSNVTVEGSVVLNGGQTTGAGGTVFVENATSTLSFTGATIDGGKAGSSGGNIYTKSDLTLVDTLLTHGEAGTGSGGNLYMTGCDVTMTGGYITGGTNGKTYSGSSKPNGGNVYISSSATFTLNSGSVDGGKTINTGGNIVCYGKFVMNGGQIFGGCKINSDGTIASSNATSGNVYVVNADMEMHGGHIDGGVAIFEASTLKLSGNPSMTSSYEGEGANELYLNGTEQVITIDGTLTTEGRVAKICKTANASYVFSTETGAENAAFFTSYTEGESVFFNSDSKLEIGKVMCICGFVGGKHIGDCKGDTFNWHAWTGTGRLPTTTGYYYLTKDLETTGTSSVNSSSQKIALDLNGHTIYSTSGASRIFSTYNGTDYFGATHLTLVNSGSTGVIQGWNKGGDGKTASENGMIWAASKDTVINLYNVILDASANTAASDSKIGLCVSATGTSSKVNVFNSQLLGGVAAKGDALGLNATKTDQVIRLEGDVVLTGTEGSVLYMGGEGNTINVSKLTSLNAPITVEASGVFTTGWNKDANIADFFVPGIEDSIICLEGDELAMRPYHCICEMPDGKHVEGFCDGTKFVWKPWSKSYMPSTGNWYLTGDVTEATDYRVLSTNDAVVRVDLNGYNFTSGENRMFTTYKSNVATDLTIEVIMTNTKADDRSVVTITGSGDQGRVMWLRGENKTLKVNNIDFVAAEGATSSSNGFFFSAQPQSGTNKTGNHLELYNVTMTGGEAAGSASAGALCGGANTSVVLKDVTITGCSGTEGGAIRMVSNSALTMENVTFDGCSTTGRGAAVYATGTCAVSVKNVSVTNCTGANDKGIYLNDKATLNMTGIVKADIYRTVNTKLDVADLADGSSITISGDTGVISANDYTTDDADLAYLSTASDDLYLLVTDGKLYLKASSCICGMPDGKHVTGFCDSTVVKWQPWSGTKAPTASGNYFLTGDVTFSSVADMKSTDGNIVIDLNGNDIIVPAASTKNSTGRMYTTYLSADSSSTSKVDIKFTNTTSTTSTIKVEGVGDQGRVVWLTGSNKSLSVYNVDIDMSTAATREEKRLDGIAIAIEGTGNEAKLFDMNIIGGTTTSQGGALYVGNGCSTTMNRCVVDGCEAKVGLKSGAASGGYGGFAYVRGNMTLNDCTIQNCSAEKSGAAIYLYGSSATKRAKLIVNGGSIENCVGSGDNGGAINLQAYADAEMADVTIKNCSAKNAGAIEIKEGNTLEMTDCVISGCSGKYAGAIYVNSSIEGSPATLIMDGCTIEDCSATTGYGGAIVAGVTNNDVTYTRVELTDTTIKNCSAKGRAGAIHVSNGSEVILDGCTIEGCTDTARAGAIYSYKGYVTLIDCTLKNNSANGSTGKGGAVYLLGHPLTLGGKIVITDNTATVDGNNVYLNGQKIVVSTEKPLADSSVIGVSPETGYKPTISTTVSYAQKDLFVSDHDTLQIVHDGTNLKFANASEHWHCVCGGQPTGDPNHVCKDIQFTAIDSLQHGQLENGNYYLTDSIKISGVNAVELNGEKIAICLNGHTLTPADGKRAFYLTKDKESELTLTSCKDNGTVVGGNAEGGVISLRDNGGTVNLYNLTLDSSNVVLGTSSYGTAIHARDIMNIYNTEIIGATNAENASKGGALMIESAGVVNMYSSTIRDGRTSSTDTSAGNVHLKGVLNMYDSTITGGNFSGTRNSAANNIRVRDNATLNMVGGYVDGHIITGKTSTVKLSGDANVFHTGNRGIYMYGGKTNLLIGDLSDDAKIELIVMKDDSNAYYDVFASALDGYTLTEQDVACITATTTAGAKRGNVVLNTDNTISVVAE